LAEDEYRYRQLIWVACRYAACDLAQPDEPGDYDEGLCLMVPVGVTQGLASRKFGQGSSHDQALFFEHGG
jgi:hypothetical protein